MRRMHATLLALGFAAAGPAPALTTHCVDSAAELRAALAATGVQDDVEIKIAPGTYATGGTRFSTSMHGARALTVSGGWIANCLVQVRDAGLTVLDGGALSQVLFVATADDVTTARAVLSNFTVKDGKATQALAGGLSVHLNDGTPSVLLDRLRLQGNQHIGGPGGGLRIFNFTAGKAVLRNSLVTGNSALRGGGVSISSSVAGAVTQLVNNTILANQAAEATFTAGGVIGDYTFPAAGSIEMRNNAVFFNTAGGQPMDVHAVTNAGGLVATRNAYSVTASGKVIDSGSFVVADPRFVGADDYRPASDSPLIDAGAALTGDDAASRDHGYLPRIMGAAPDIGAHESNWRVFRNSFE